MPFYDFKCSRCELTFNVMATIEEKEKGLIPCPGCGSKDIQRSYDKANISLKSREAARHENCSCCQHSDGCPSAH